MVVEDLDLELRAKLAYSGNPESKVTMVFVPGFGTMGRGTRKIGHTQAKLSKKGIDLNVASFTYRSHLGTFLSGFENDSKDLEKIVKKLEGIGIPKDMIGLLSICYGSHVAQQFLLENDGIGFAIMVQPYFGIDSVKSPYREIAKMAKSAIQIAGFPNLWIGYRYGRHGYLDIQSFFENDRKNIHIANARVPILTIVTRVHRFMDPTYILNPRSESEIVEIVDGTRISKTSVKDFYRLVQKFLFGIYGDSIKPIGYETSKTPSKI